MNLNSKTTKKQSENNSKTCFSLLSKFIVVNKILLNIYSIKIYNDNFSHFFLFL